MSSVLDLTEQLYQAKLFVSVLSFANSIFCLYAVLQSFVAGYLILSLVCALVFFFNCVLFALSTRKWKEERYS